MAVVTGPAALDLERFAAQELCAYLDKLFGVKVRPSTEPDAAADILFLLGNRATNPTIATLATSDEFKGLTDQGFILRTVRQEGGTALILGGASPKATLWAVYELAGRWGVRSLLHGDVLPEPRPLEPPKVDVRMEPALPIRQWRVVNDFAMGPESWGMADYRPVIDQLAKMKFNRILVSTYTYQPFLDLQVQGVRRRRASLWFDFHYPITEDMIGRELFGDASEFWNPDLPLNASYDELAAAGEKHLRELMQYAQSRGMQVAMTATLTEYPPEFAALLPGAQKVHQLGEMGIVPGPETGPDHPAVTTLATAVLQTTANTYPAVDIISLGMPEFRQWTEQYEAAWQELDARYGIEEVLALEQVLAAARRRTGYPGGADRAVQEVKGDIVALRFYDRLVRDMEVFADTKRPDMRIMLNSVSEELFPVLPKVLPPGSEVLNFIDYTPSRIVRRREVIGRIPAGEIPCSLIYTLHDDNVGVLPQLATGSLHELTKDLYENGWAGFSTRYWLIADHDLCVAYLSQAGWDRSATPKRTYADVLGALCGEGCVGDLTAMLEELERATVLLEWHGLGLTFPVPGMMMNRWRAGSLASEVREAQEGYRRALALARQARGRSSPGGEPFIDYWIGRLAFGISYLDALDHVNRAATKQAEGDAVMALKHARGALEAVRSGLQSFAGVARDQSDRGAIAVMNEYVYRPLRDKVDELAAAQEREGDKG